MMRLSKKCRRCKTVRRLEIQRDRYRSALLRLSSTIVFHQTGNPGCIDREGVARLRYADLVANSNDMMPLMYIETKITEAAQQDLGDDILYEMVDEDDNDKTQGEM